MRISYWSSDVCSSDLTTQRGLWNLIRYKPDTNLSIGLRFAQLAAAQPQAPALRFEAQTWTYAEFHAWANRIAYALSAPGVARGHAVALLLENRPVALACALAIVKHRSEETRVGQGWGSKVRYWW